MLAILSAVKKWNAYLLGRHFKIRTDHFSLKFLLDQETTTPAQQHWVIKMMGYDYDVVFRKGVSNVVADALSRLPGVELKAISVINFDLMKRIQHSWVQDPYMVHLIHSISKHPGKHSKYTWKNNQLRRKDKLVIGCDLQLRKDLLLIFHNSAQGGHSGVGATAKRMGAVLYWKGLRKDIRHFVRTCSICQQFKSDHSAYPGLLQPLPIPKTIWTDISMDFIEGLPKSQGFTVILVVVDRLSKYAHFLPMSYPYTALTVAQTFLDNVFKLHGLPTSIVSDCDKIFTSNFWKELFKLLGTQLKLSTAYHPQTDGQTEVLNRGLQTYLRCMAAEKPREWSRWLPLAEWWYNTNYHSAINTTPYEAVYGQPAPLYSPHLNEKSTVMVVDRSLKARQAAIEMLKFYLARAQNRMKQQADKGRSDRQFTVGDWVYVKLQPYRQSTVVNRANLKLSAKFFGPYQVLEKIGAVGYRLDLPPGAKVHSVFHVSQLKLHKGPVGALTPLSMLTDEGVLAKEPLAILDRRIGKRQGKAVTEVLVQWRNTFPEDATWEALPHLMLQYPHFHP